MSITATPRAGPILEARQVTKRYALPRTPFAPRRELVAVDGVDLELLPGECLAVVGESGSGKSTLARCLSALSTPTEGQILYDGRDVKTLTGKDKDDFRHAVQPVFQEPFSSLDPRWTVDQTLGEALALGGAGRTDRAKLKLELLNQVGLSRSVGPRRPRELSGGQCQRVAIAAALAVRPKVLVADEPVSALDVSVRAQVLNLLARLQRELDLTIVLITHDLSLVEHISDRIAVMYLGRIVELGQTRDMISRRVHPYTDALLAAVPRPEPGRRPKQLLAGEVPSPISPPSGCHFHPRCPIAIDACSSRDPEMTDFGLDRRAACLVRAAESGRAEPHQQIGHAHDARVQEAPA